jgi:GntR family transcriptional regulator
MDASRGGSRGRRPGSAAGTNPLTSALRQVWRDAAESGGTLPPEVELATDLGVSRSKLREALVRLEAEGLVSRHSGGGTYANQLALQLPLRLDESFEFADMLREAGHVPSVEVLEHVVVSLDEEDAATLEVDPGTRALRTLKRWRSDGVAAAIATDLVPMLRRPDPENAASTMTVFEQVEWAGGGQVQWECGWPGARLATDDEPRLLEVAAGAPVFTLELIGVSRAGERGFLAREVHVPGVVQWGLIRTIRRSGR